MMSRRKEKNSEKRDFFLHNLVPPTQFPKGTWVSFSGDFKYA
jgi:hypothetical protein